MDFDAVSSLVKITNNAISKENCISIIDAYEDMKDLHFAGLTLGGVNLKYKDSTDLNISHEEPKKRFPHIDKLLYESLQKELAGYIKYLKSGAGNPLGSKIFENLVFGAIQDTGFLMKKYKNGDKPGYYHWHNDFSFENEGPRMLTFIWYLNDVEEGGETEIYNGLKVKPEAGKFLLFPSCWTYLHRGISPVSNNKYIISGWINETG